MGFEKLTYLELLDKRQEINKAINTYDERDKIKAYTVTDCDESMHYADIVEASKSAIEIIQSNIDTGDLDDLECMFDMNFNLKITNFTQPEFDVFVIKRSK